MMYKSVMNIDLKYERIIYAILAENLHCKSRSCNDETDQKSEIVNFYSRCELLQMTLLIISLLRYDYQKDQNDHH